MYHTCFWFHLFFMLWEPWGLDVWPGGLDFSVSILASDLFIQLLTSFAREFPCVPSVIICLHVRCLFFSFSSVSHFAFLPSRNSTLCIGWRILLILRSGRASEIGAFSWIILHFPRDLLILCCKCCGSAMCAKINCNDFPAFSPAINLIFNPFPGTC